MQYPTRIYMKHWQVCSRLARHRWWAMFNFVSPHQITPLHWAAEKGHVNVVQYLLEKGANMNIKEWKEGGVSQSDCTTDHGLVLWIIVPLIRVWVSFTSQVPDKGLESTVHDYVPIAGSFHKCKILRKCLPGLQQKFYFSHAHACETSLSQHSNLSCCFLWRQIVRW